MHARTEGWLDCIVDILSRRKNKEIVWNERNAEATHGAEKISFDRVPFVIIGRQVLECCYGNARKHTSNVATSTV